MGPFICPAIRPEQGGEVSGMMSDQSIEALHLGGLAGIPFFKNGIGQIALVVENVDEAVETYWKLFGVGPWYIYTYGKPLIKKMAYWGKPAEFKMRVALSRIGDLHIELIQPLEGENIYTDFVEAHGYGLHHLAVMVEDVEAAIAQAQAAGLAVKQEGSGFGLDGDGHFAYLDTEDKIGLTLELLSLPKRRVEPEKVYPPSEDT